MSKRRHHATRTPVDSHILERCRATISDTLGSLDDLPHELANTVANVHYRLFDHMARSSSNQASALEGGEGSLSRYIDELATVGSAVKMARGFVEDLRKMDRDQDPGLYDYTVDFILDILKYRILDAHKKSGLQRLAERQSAGSRVKEIPNLAVLLGVTRKRDAPKLRGRRGMGSASPSVATGAGAAPSAAPRTIRRVVLGLLSFLAITAVTVILLWIARLLGGEGIPLQPWR